MINVEKKKSTLERSAPGSLTFINKFHGGEPIFSGMNNIIITLDQVESEKIKLSASHTEAVFSSMSRISETL